MKASLILAALLPFSLSAWAADQAEWTPLFDGTSLKGWVDGDGKPVEAGKWVIEDGILHLTDKGGGNLYTAKKYLNFELSWEWKISANGNSGVKYLMAAFEGKGLLGPEYQLYDDGDKPFEKGATASIYALVAPDEKTKKAHPLGEWNRSRISVKDGHIEHFLNGKKVAEITVGTPEWKAAVGASKFKGLTGFAEKAGPVMLQDHGTEAWFRQIRIREL